MTPRKSGAPAQADAREQAAEPAAKAGFSYVVLVENGEHGRRGAVKRLPEDAAQRLVERNKARRATKRDLGIAGIMEE